MIRNTYQNTTDSRFLSHSAFQEQMLKLILDSVLEFIRITKEELMIAPELNKEFKSRAIAMVKLMVHHFHHRVFNHANANYFTLKFQRSLKKDSINLLKKIFIFLREQG